MTQQELAQQLGFTCGACGKQFRWKPELAGKTVPCKCSAKIVVPATAGGVAHPKGGNGNGNGSATPAAAIARTSAAPGLAGAARAAEVPPRAPAATTAKKPAATPPPLPKAAAPAKA